MKRRLFTILSALSLLLCVAVVVLWVRSYFKWDSLGYGGKNQRYELTSLSGRVGIFTVKFSNLTVEHGLGWSVSSDLPRDTPGMHTSLSDLFVPHWDTEGYKFEHATYSSLTVTVPYTYAALATMALPMLWFVLQVRLRRKLRSGVCPVCGYDLRATPGRCPECGLVPPLRRRRRLDGPGA